MARRRDWAAAGWVGMAALAAGATAHAGVTGRVLWEDGQGNTHALRRIEVQLYDTNNLVESTTTDLNGDYTFNASPNPLLGSLTFVARNPAAEVSFDGTPGTAYTAGVPLFAAPTGYTIANNHDQFRAFGVVDAMYTTWYLAEQNRPADPARIPVVFPTSESTSFFSPANNNIHILSDDRWDWDVIGHEYAHYLAHLDDLDQSPGGDHSMGVSNIPARGKLDGVRLAWGEGLGSFLGVAAQHYNTTGQNMPTNLQDAGNTLYDDRIDQDLHVDLDTNISPANHGEGDEASIMRILWDIGDNPAGDDDALDVGFGNLYQALRIIPTVDQLDDLWDYYFNTFNDQRRSELGAIFEEQSVSPHPFGLPISAALDPSDPPPTFEWERRNDDRNDMFRLIVFNDDLTARFLDINIPGDVTSYTLSADEWALLTGMPQQYRFIIAGTDSTDFTTGGYWSGAFDFTVVPEPLSAGIIAGLAAVLLGARRHRRRNLV